MNQFDQTAQQVATEHMQQLDAQTETKRNMELNENLDIIENGFETEQRFTPNPVIQERYFVGIYLPWFAGEDVLIPAADGSAVPMTSDHWLAVSGHYNTEVDVVNERGEFLYSVPALVNSLKIMTNYDKVNYSLTAVFQRYKQEADVYPASARDNLRYELDRSVAVENGDIKDEDAQRWYDIFKRYGYIDSVEENKGDVSVPQTEQPSDDEAALASMMILR